MCIRYAQRPGGVVTIIIANQGRNVNEQSVNFRFFVKIFKKGFLQLDFLSHGKYTGTVKADSINKAIRRYMQDARDDKGCLLSEKYPKETQHAIRKLYATERMKEERGQAPLADKKEEMKHWNKVSHELGHGNGREDLYKTYCKR